jgi:hypothetical protein
MLLGLPRTGESQQWSRHEAVAFLETRGSRTEPKDPCVIILLLTLIDKCKMCHFECHELKLLKLLREFVICEEAHQRLNFLKTLLFVETLGSFIKAFDESSK